ncbi:Striatin-interacting protein 2 [Tyrophagus putrescentiae]|nr:Striatin-interacting protein 2 [Tyrophagus putrescentiae]
MTERLNESLPFEELSEDYGYPLKWTQALPGQRARVVERLGDRLELTERDTRVRASRALLYLAQGNFAHWQLCLLYDRGKAAQANNFTLFEYDIIFLLLAQSLVYRERAAQANIFSFYDYDIKLHGEKCQQMESFGKGKWPVDGCASAASVSHQLQKS